MNRRRLCNGLLEVLALVEADVESDVARYKKHAVHDAIEWLNDLRRRLRHEVLAPPVPREALRGLRTLRSLGSAELDCGQIGEYGGASAEREVHAALVWIDNLED